MAITVTSMSNPFGDDRDTNKIICSLTSDASGDVTGDIASTFTSGQEDFQARPSKLQGYLQRVLTNPDGTAAPTDDYDLVITDADGVDVCDGALSNRDSAQSEHLVLDPPPYIDSELTLTGSNMGSTKTTVVTLVLGSRAQSRA